MNSASKSLHEDAGHSIPLRRPFEGPSISSDNGGTDFHIPYESAQDGRPAKMHRVELHNVDKSAGSFKQMMTSPSRYFDVEKSLEAQEAVGENKADTKDEGKFRENDRKKHIDFGEREKDKSDHQNSLQVVGSINAYPEDLGEERETEWLKRERIVVLKEKKQNDKEKYQNKDKSPNTNENKNLQHDKESVDITSRISVKETEASQLQQNNDTARASDSYIKYKGKEVDIDVEDKNEKHDKCKDKESDDGCEDEHGVREIYGQVGQSILQQCISMQPKGTQSPHQEHTLWFREQDNERFQGQSKVSAVMYKPGICMQELLNSWREFEASKDNNERLQNGPLLEIKVPAEYVTTTNRQVRGAQLWGSDIYTHDSDLVAVLMHTGYCRLTASPLPAVRELRATVEVLPPQESYASVFRNKVRSRAWGIGSGCSFRVERCCIVKEDGGSINLEPCSTRTSAVESTLALLSAERKMTTRARASNASRQQRYVRDVAIQYNLCNEPWLKYCISLVADRGLKKPLFTATRLKKGEVLYLETLLNRYELCFHGEHPDREKLHNHSSLVVNDEKSLKNHENVTNLFRWSHCKKPLPQNIMHSVGIPLPTEHLEVLAENLEWEDLQWSQTGVWVAGKEYVLARAQFFPRT